MSRRLTRLLDYLGLERNVLVMTASGCIRGLGVWLWSGYVAKVLESLGASPLKIGAFGTVSAVVSIAFSFLGGSLSDRLGRGRALIAAATTALAGYALYATAPTWWLLLPGSLLLTAGAQAEFMGSQALVGETVAPERRAVSMASQRIIAYLPAMVSPPLGGLLMERLGVVIGFRVAVGITLVLTLLAIRLQRRHFRLPPPVSSKLSLDIPSAWRAVPTGLRWLLLSNGLVFFGSRMSGLFAVLYAMNTLGVGAVRYGFLQALEIAALLLLIVPIGRLADRRGIGGRKLLTGGSFLFNALFSLMLGLVHSPRWLVPIFLLPGIRESFEPVRKALIIDLAGRGEHGRVIGLYYLGMGILTFPASFLAGWLWQANPTAPFLAAACISAAGFALHVVSSLGGRSAPVRPSSGGR